MAFVTPSIRRVVRALFDVARQRVVRVVPGERRMCFNSVAELLLS